MSARAYRASGADIMRATRIPSGTVYPILFRFEEARLLDGDWENIDPSKEGRPRRYVYRLTGQGERVARAALNEVTQSLGAKLKWT